MQKQERVRIIDIAQELGLSTATVSNVIHGKTKKISDETVKRVQALLEEKQYIPSMAGILLARNDSRIIGIVVNNHEKYEGHALEDAFVAASLNHLALETEKAGYFMMVKVTRQWDEIARFASMWNMEGLILMGFCEQDYKKLRENMHIPFVVYDGYFKEPGRICNLIIDNYDGGYQTGAFFKNLGHQKVLCISDNDVCMDYERFRGFAAGMQEYGSDFMQVPMHKEERWRFYREKLNQLKSYTAIFAVSDYYAADLMQFLQKQGIRIPEDISIAGFDDCALCRTVFPPLTTVKQDGEQRASLAIEKLKELREGKCEGVTITLPVTLVERESTKRI